MSADDTPAVSDALGKKLCEALGIDPKNVRKIVLTFEARQPVTVTIERLGGYDHVDRVLAVFRHEYTAVHRP